MKQRLHHTLLGMVAFTQVGCGVSLLDKMGSPAKTRKHQVLFENRSSARIQIFSSLAETTAVGKCEPGFTDDLKAVAPGETTQIQLETVCREAARAFVRIELIRDYDVGVIGIENPSVAARLTPGFVFHIQNREGTLRFPVEVVEASQASADHPNPWAFPVMRAAPVAWLSYHQAGGQTFWRLNIAVPKSLSNETLDVAFHKSTGIDDFGSYPIRDRGDELVASFTRFHGEPIWPQVTSERVLIICDDLGCSTQEL